MDQVIVNGVSYLGTLEVGEDGVVVKNAVKTAQTITKDDVTRYFTEKNVDNLETVQFGGNGVSYSVVSLTDEVVMFTKMSELVMEQAKKVAVKNLENSEFRNGLGKL